MRRIALALTLTAAACGPDPLHPADLDHDATDTGIEPDGSSSSDGSSSGEPADSDSETGDDRPEDPSQPGSCTLTTWREQGSAEGRKALRLECPPCDANPQQLIRCCSELGECGCTSGYDGVCCPRGQQWIPPQGRPAGHCIDGELGDYCTTADDCPYEAQICSHEEQGTWPDWGQCVG